MTQFLINFVTVFIQVLVLFVFVGCGFVGAKTKIITNEGSKVMSNLVLYFATPCLIISSLNIKFEKDELSVTTGISMTSFSLDNNRKGKLWDEKVQRILDNLGLEYEELE